MRRLTDLRDYNRFIRQWIRLHPWYSLAAAILAGMIFAGYALTRPGALWGPIDGTWHRSQVNKDLYVGVDPSYPPFAEWTPEEIIIGIEPDIARAIGDQFGVNTSILIMGYDGLYDALFTGEVDFIIAGIQVDSGQQHWVHYTQPYFDAGAVLVSHTTAPIEHIRELDGKIIAVELASLGDQTAIKWQRRLHSLSVRRHLLPRDAIEDVLAGDADAALIDTVSARQLAGTYPELVLAPYTTAPQEYLIALRRADFRLVKEVEKALTNLRADGTLESIVDTWLPLEQR